MGEVEEELEGIMLPMAAWPIELVNVKFEFRGFWVPK